MPSYPTPGAYQEALQFPEDVFTDPELQEAVPEVNALGLPVAVTGAFAVVFSVETQAGRRAVKCFLRPVPDQQARYRAIARHLERVALPHMVGFDFQSRGLRLGDRTLPLLKMDWADGEGLGRFVARHLDAPETLERLAERWTEMLARLERAEVAHGDLQHGNVLVRMEAGLPQLQLVDYDTLYVPALAGRKSAEVGHRNYQHPDRDEHDFGPYLDRFAGLVIYVALQACRAAPELWARYDTGENLLFREADFYDPESSPLFAELEGHEELRALAEALRAACYLEPAAVPSLDEVRAGGRSSAPSAAVLRRAWAVRRKGPAGAEPSGSERLAAPALVVSILTAALLIGFGWTAAGLVVLLLGLAGVGAAAGRGYRRLSVVRRRRRLRREALFYREILDGLQRQVETLQREREQLQAQAGQRKRARLEALRERALEDRLKYHFVGEAARFEGVTHKVVVRLKASGIRNAYQATPERLAAIRQLSDQSRARVAMWRAALAAQYEEELPERLSPAEERRLERYVERRADSLAAEQARARAKIQVQQKEREEVEARREALPRITFGRYLRYLLRLGTLPAAPVPPPPTPAPLPGESTLEPAPQPAEGGPWWRSG